MLYYRSKDEGLFDERLLDSITHRSWIEILPMSKQNFDIISFIEFIDCLSPEYICTYFNSKKYIVYVAVINRLSIDHESIKIYIKDNFTNITVFIKDGLHYMLNAKINGSYYICFKRFSLDEKKKNYFSNKKQWADHLQFKNSIFSNFAKYVAKSQTRAPIFLKYAFQSFQDKRTISRKKNLSTNIDILSMLNHLPGYVYFRFSDINKNNLYDSKMAKKIGCLINFNKTEKILRNIIWIMPWAYPIIDYVQYLELDASFKASKPYSYAIFHGILFNSSIPFALSISPVESIELFEMFFIGLKKFKLNEKKFENKYMLSDMGPALISFSKLHSMILYFCHRHIIENFGANCGIGLWAQKLLRCKTLKEFLFIRKQIEAEINAFLSKKIKSPEIGLDDDSKINDLKIMLLLPEDVQKIENSEKIINSNYFIEKWANWIRRDNHVPRCSNHCEGFHSNINSTLTKKGTYSFKTGFGKIIDFIINYLSNRKESYKISFQKKHSKIIEKVRNILKEGPNSYSKLSNENCDCEDCIYNQMIYGIDFPCIHTILHNFIASELFQTFFKKYPIQYNDFFITCIKYCPISFFEKNKFYFNIKSITHKITLYIISFYNKIFSEKEHDVIADLAFHFLECFVYSLPPFLNINVAEYTSNVTDFDEIDEDFNFVIRKKKKTQINLGKNEIIKDFLKSDDEDLKFARIKYYETKNEIVQIYPQLKDLAENICFDIFLDYFNAEKKSDSENIFYKTAQFKIECWHLADIMAKDNKFFG